MSYLARDIMRRKVITVPKSMDLRDLAKLFLEKGITGAPVVLEQSDGTQMEGRRLRYDMETGQVRVLSEPRTQGPEAELAEPEEGDDG